MSTIDRAALEAEREFLLDSIEDLDREHAAGALRDDEYRALRDQQTVRAAEVLRALQAPSDRRAEPMSRSVVDASPNTDATAARRPPRVSRRAVIWASGVAVFVLLAAGMLMTGAGDRLGGDTTTGSVAKDSNTLLAEAQELQAKGKAVDALKAYDKVLQVDPANVQALTYRGWLIRLAGLPGEGLESIDRALALDAHYPDAHFFKGFILLRDRQQPAAAIPEFQAFLDNDPPADMVPLVEQAMRDAQAQVAAVKP